MYRHIFDKIRSQTRMFTNCKSNFIEHDEYRGGNEKDRHEK